MDEADRILDLNFDQEVEKILKALPEERHTSLYSATMTEKVLFQISFVFKFYFLVIKSFFIKIFVIKFFIRFLAYLHILW